MSDPTSGTPLAPPQEVPDPWQDPSLARRAEAPVVPAQREDHEAKEADRG